MREIATKEAVWAAASALDATGVTPNAVLIRERVGGSFSTIQKHLRSWEADRAAAQAVSVPAEIDDQVAQFATQLARDLWRTASQHSAAEITQVRQQARAEVVQAEAEREQAYSVINRLEEEAEVERAHAAKAISDLEREAEKRTGQLTASQREIETLREELATARTQIQVEQTRASELERQLTQTRAELEQARQQASAQLSEAVAAIQQQLAAQATQLQRLAQGREEH